MEAAFSLLQTLFKDIQNLLGGGVLLQREGLLGLGQALLEEQAEVTPAPQARRSPPLGSPFSPAPQH